MFPGLFAQPNTIKTYLLQASRTALRSWQSDYGVTLGATPRASGSPPAATIAGSVSGPVAPRWEITATGILGTALFRYTHLNTGTTAYGGQWIEQGVTVPLGGTYALQGAMSGVTMTFPAGTYTSGAVYQGTCSSWTDLVAGATAVQATAANQPRLLVDAGGRVQLYFDAAQWLLNASFTTPQPGTLPILTWGCWQRDTWTLNRAIWGCGGGGTNGHLQLSDRSTTPNIQAFCGGLANINAGAGVGARVRSEALFTSTSTDRIKLGVTSSGGVSAGNGVAGMAGFVIGSSTSATTFAMTGAISDVCVFTGGDLTAAELAAMSAAAKVMRRDVVI